MTTAASSGAAYGALGLPLAFVALPLYVVLPNHYAAQFGVPLAALGVLLLAVRAFDALVDPWIGRWVDALLGGATGRIWAVLGLAALVLVAGLTGLFFPLASVRGSSSALLGWCGALLVGTYLAYSVASVLHQSWGARLGGGDAAQARWVGWREGAALVGVVLASVLPSVAGLSAMVAVFALALGVALMALTRAPRPVLRSRVAVVPLSMAAPWRVAGFRRLVAVFLLNGIASAVPATLVLFFVRDRLQAPALEGAFLAVYFVAGAVSLPLWVRGVARWGLVRIWAVGMALAVVTFVGALALGAGDTGGFFAVCLASGLALGADLVVPGALLAGVVRRSGQGGAAEGAFFGWWNSATKLNLALAAGLALPVLQWAGYTPGSRDADALWSLSLAYAALPCVLKLLALGALWRLRRVLEGETP
ncbi:MFS transporter [Sphaerotilus sp.]|uniref:MFS transporter n=1 Tax=Sphaerotilus sp. TaxID=2093942 RepID=UPI00286E83CC|nr:MFS transporter [Sphaerotilus sp.]